MTTPSKSSRWDFDALYRGESPAEGVPPVTNVPWDNKAPKEVVISWQEAGLVTGAVLDIGCGLGDNAIYLAQHGHSVTALDISPTALITAERRAQDAAVEVKFAVANATELTDYTAEFDTVIDVGMFHCLDDAGKPAYATAVHRATKPGARLLLACFSDADQQDPQVQHRGVGEQSLRDIFGNAGWNISSLTQTSVGRPGDEDVQMVFWFLQAERS